MCYPNLNPLLLRFKVFQFCLGRTHYLLLPKLNPSQMRIVARRLAKLGGQTESKGVLSAKTKDGVVHVDPKGLCWSRADPADALLPVMPEVLSCPKAKVSLGGLRARYYRLSKAEGTTSIRLSLRLESGPTWVHLRRLDKCALAPDEHLVARSLLTEAGASCKVVADYPASDSGVLRLGVKRYFESVMDADEAASALRSVGTRAERNSYICRNETLSLTGGPAPGGVSADVFGSLGEWCFFTV